MERPPGTLMPDRFQETDRNIKHRDKGERMALARSLEFSAG